MTVFTEQPWWNYLSYAITVAAAASAVLPVPKQVGTVLAYARKILDVVALNVANSKNEKRPGTAAVYGVEQPKVDPDDGQLRYSDGTLVPKAVRPEGLK